MADTPNVNRSAKPSERTCVLTRRTGPPEAMIRFVRGPDDTVVPDIARRLPGRGAWLLNTRAVVDGAARKNPFRRAFGGDVTVPEDLGEQVDRLFARRALATLAMANKAGLVVSGFDKVRECLKRRKVAVLVSGADAADDGRMRLARLASHVGEAHKGAPVVTAFSIDDLSGAVGKANVVHVGVAGHPLADAFVRQTARLASYRALEGSAGGTGEPPATAERSAGGPERQTGGGASATARSDKMRGSLRERSAAAGEPAGRDGAGGVGEQDWQTRAFAGTRAV